MSGCGIVRQTYRRLLFATLTTVCAIDEDSDYYSQQHEEYIKARYKLDGFCLALESVDTRYADRIKSWEADDRVRWEKEHGQSYQEDTR